MAKGKSMGNTSKKTGMLYEEKAALFLKDEGCQILEKNFYSPFGEIDIVAREKEYLVFVEVKYRASDKGGHPLEAVDARKQRRIRKAAVFYILSHGGGTETPCRFDVIGILGDEINHIRDAF